MTLNQWLARAAVITTMASAASLCMAQGATWTAKKDLVQKVLQLQQSGIEGIGNQLANQTASQVMQMAGQALNRLPADKRETVGTEVQAEVRKFYDDVAPLLRERALKLAPSTIGAALEDKFSEDELKVLITWLESPTNRKFQQVAGEMQQALGQKLIAESRPQIEPKLKALEQTLTAKFDAAAGTPTAKASAPKAAASAASAPRAKK